ncbi:ABC-type branched-chain amino acid transport system, substrate-binding protein [Lishizhenia tianjinensis]|uniref:ABC-type branched-chain amino acid transport system, substrate-binding protein n=1 Tax=Lishizhenia tianjinensis TaxID=477690 RepID=A0A1I7A554_9FLAO|nr:LysM peptidoglycan-binding domain-containing protein [Lishizhenia tianjinensis]SFT70061.1 ABC-type branched-chain amino acid transport system, substrate-binding protein [Lishizhenia tianjinensis]
MRFIGILVMMLLASTLVAQEGANKKDKIETTMVNGKKCLVHVVESGNTLYSLHRQYEVAIAEIVALNPNAEAGLQVGQVVYIPLENSNIQTHKIHIVEARQTLYGISRLYDVSVADIVALNPGADQGLQIGQQLKIPTLDVTSTPVKEVEKNTSQPIVNNQPLVPNTPSVQWPDSVETHTVQKGETLYRIALAHKVTMLDIVKENDIVNGEIKVGQILVIPTKEKAPVFAENAIPFISDSNYVAPKFEQKSKYKVAVILPFHITKNPEVLSGMITPATELNKLTDLSVDFYMGAKMALDSLAKLGLTAEVKFYDSKASAAEVESILKGYDFKNTDIIIGPLFNQTITPVANWAKANNARMIVPFNANTSVLKSNPYVSFALPSDLTLIKSLAHYYALEHGDDNVVLVKSGLAKDNDAYRVFREEFNRLTTPQSYRAVLKEVQLTDAGKELSAAIVKDTLTVFVDLSSDKAHAMRFLTTLNRVKNESKHEDARVAVVGVNDWMKFDDLSNYYKNRFQLHYASPNHLDYSTPAMKTFVTSYRTLYNADPSKYAVQGFDVTYAYLSQYLLMRNVNEGLMNDIRLESRGVGNGTENGTCFILKQENFEIKRVGKVINQRVY